ncbi:MAG: TerD family protein [Myxococcales bacterium]|nr:TerD family protein [Myxococcales bacterium]MCB9541591.1 TerD family protein [Myxococcales bacterium]MCB9552465.1 TerD family protein [Myxococcales bacterium]
MLDNRFGPLDEILLRRRGAVLLTGGDGSLPLAWVATAMRNLEALGYVAHPALVDRLCTLSEAEFVRFVGPLVGALKKAVGAHVRYAPMYPDFPTQVMAASDVELYVNALMHYFGDVVGLRILPDYTPSARPPLPAGFLPAPKVVRLGDLDELAQIGRDLIGANTSISATDKADVVALLAAFGDDVRALLPPRIPHKENLSVVTAALIDHPAADLLLTPFFTGATDVLRLATSLCGGDVSLAKNTRFKAIKRARRRLLLALLDRIADPLEDMNRHREKWLRLGERLHPGEHRDRSPNAAAAFDKLRAGETGRAFNAAIEAALRTGAVARAAELLATRPGDFTRRLDHLLRRARDPMAVVRRFAEVAGPVSTPVLLQAMVHFEHRADGNPIRAFFPKGDAAKVISVPNALPPLPEPVRRAAADACRAALTARFAALPPLGRVYVDPGLADHLVPFAQRSASKALRTLVRGSRVPLPDGGDTARFFLWWKEGLVDGKPTGRVDVDLSAALYGPAWDYMEHISWTSLRSARFKGAHSGDITSAPNGACEFIDLDLPSVARAGGRYVVALALVYTRHPFCALPECFMGWMSRREPASGEVFDPRTVVDRVDLASEARICLPIILDVVDRVVVWTDVGLRSHPKWNITLEANHSGVQHLGRAMTTLCKPTLRDLFTLHAEARGERVDDPAAADVVFSVEAGTPFEIERTMAAFLA